LSTVSITQHIKYERATALDSYTYYNYCS